jgi:hypothetical protein
MFSQPLFTSLDVPSQPDVNPSQPDQDQSIDVTSYVKVKGAKTKKPKNSNSTPNQKPKQKRKGPLQDLRARYIGKKLELSGLEVTGNPADSTLYKFYVSEVNRRKLGGDKLIPVLNFICETNPKVSMSDVPLDIFKDRLDAAQVDKSRIMTQPISDEAVAALITAKRNKRRKLVMDNCVESVDMDDTLPDPTHQYSDEEEDELPIHGFSMLDSIIESRRGLDVEDAEPISIHGKIDEESEVNLDELHWTRCDYNDIPADDSDAYSQTTRPTREALDASSTPLSLLLLLLPHSFWENVSRFSEAKRQSIIMKLSDTNRHDLKYLNTPITPKKIFSFVLVLIINMLQPFAGGISNHWRTDSTFIRRAGTVPIIMCRDEFRAIGRCLCFYHPSNLDTTTGLPS